MFFKSPETEGHYFGSFVLAKLESLEKKFNTPVVSYLMSKKKVFNISEV